MESLEYELPIIFILTIVCVPAIALLVFLWLSSEHGSISTAEGRKHKKQSPTEFEWEE